MIKYYHKSDSCILEMFDRIWRKIYNDKFSTYIEMKETFLDRCFNNWKIVKRKTEWIFTYEWISVSNDDKIAFLVAIDQINDKHPIPLC